MSRLLTKLSRGAKRVAENWRLGGVSAVRKYLKFRARHFREKDAYQIWLEKSDAATRAFRDEARQRVESFQSRPLVSILLPVYNVDEKWLRHCLESVLAQVYTNWELCIADDASTASHIRPVLDEFAAGDERIKLCFRPQNGHISAASNSALELATGDFVALLDHDDELSEDALFWAVNEINDFPDAMLIYSDEDLIDESGRRYDPKFKPDFSRDLFYSGNLVTHLSVFRTDILRGIGGFRTGFEGSQDYDLSLRVLEQIEESQIRHIPRVLYHWRAIRGSVAFSMEEKPYAHERARAAIREHFERTGRQAYVGEAVFDLHRVRYKMLGPKTRISVIVSADDDQETPHIEFVGLGCDVEIITRRGTAIAPAGELNSAARQASGSVLLFIDGNLKLRTPATVDEMIAAALQPDIGAVGGKILSEDFFVEECGVVLQEDLSAASAHNGFPFNEPGNILRNLLIGNASAVSSSCMAISRDAFESAGGFDETGIPPSMADVDLCLKLRGRGLRIMVMPHLEFVRRGKRPSRRCSKDELESFQRRWSDYVESDPFCNRNLKRDGSFQLDIREGSDLSPKSE